MLLASTSLMAAPIRIGAKVFTEQAILAQVTAQYLAQFGYQPAITGGLGSSLMRAAMENNELDLTWDYTGTALLVYNQVTEPVPKAQVYAKVKALDARKGLAWLPAAPFQNTYALALPREVAARYPELNSISDLARLLQQQPGQDHLIALDIEFANRADGLVGLAERYHLALNREGYRSMDPGLVYTALANGQVFAGLIYTTDGRINAFGLKVLEDDQGYFPDYTAAPIVKQAYLDAHPDLAEHLNALSKLLDQETMRALNAKVDIDRQSPEAVARGFLREKGLVKQG
ncbi:glycine betaine ABC transporter substrate-binding protein [Pseudomonas sp. NPDC007930]|uniref:glycine betaine ABC transporter substrate-binding protein n=1 Tax=Pseudomonas sp. NPDC007930 TaxID=3364417 RepID=UPI0036E8A92C